MLGRWTSPSRAKQCPDKCSFMAQEHENLWVPNVAWMENGQTFSRRNFAATARACCAVCSWALSRGGGGGGTLGHFAHKRRAIPRTSRPDLFAKCVTSLHCRSYVRSAHVPGSAWPGKVQPSVVYINSIWNFNDFRFRNYRYCKVLNPPSCDYYSCSYQDTRAWLDWLSGITDLTPPTFPCFVLLTKCKKCIF